MGEIRMLVRGHIDHVEKFIRHLRSQWFPLKIKHKLKDEFGKEFEVDSVTKVEGIVNEYKMIGFTCPDEFIQPVCNNLGLPTDETWFDTGEKKEGTGNSFMSGFGIKGYLEGLRLAFGDKKIKKDLTKGYWAQPIYRDHVNVLGIGYKSDGKIKTAVGEHDRI